MSQASFYQPERAPAGSANPLPRRFQTPVRAQDNLLAKPERYLLDRLCAMLPSWVTPDQLTALGVVGAAISAIGYAASNWAPGFFFLASLGLVINWFGDSLDGSLARYRKITRPRYGFFVDHATDVISNCLVFVGFGLSPYVSMSAALFTLVTYLAMTIYVLLANQVSGVFRLSFMHSGPTELRLLCIWFNTMMYVLGPVYVPWTGGAISLHSASIALTGFVVLVIFMTQVLGTARRLAREEVIANAAPEARAAPDHR